MAGKADSHDTAPVRVDFSASVVVPDEQRDDVVMMAATPVGVDILTPLVMVEQEGSLVMTALHVTSVIGPVRIPKLVMFVPGMCGHWDHGTSIDVCMN